MKVFFLIAMTTLLTMNLASANKDLLKSAHEIHSTDFLNRLRGKNVTLMLTGGAKITGKIADKIDYTSPMTKMVHVTSLEGQEFFDALIPKETIQGFIFRTK